MEEVVYAIRKGYLIGNHYMLEHFSDLTIDEGISSIRMTDQIIEEAYKIAGIKRP